MYNRLLSRTQSQKQLSDIEIKRHNQLLDDIEVKSDMFSLSSENWNRIQGMNSRKNSSSSLQVNDLSLLKNSFYRRNKEPSSKALLLARLNRNKKNLSSSKGKNLNNIMQSNLLEIEEHLNKIKTPIKKGKSSKPLKNK